MKSEEIHINDIGRILMGEVPAGFYLELIFRTAFIFLLLIVAMRLQGKRMATQMNRNELAALVSLAAAVGVCLHNADRGILPALLIAILIVGIARSIAIRAYRNPKFEARAIGDLSILVKDGVLQIAEMKKVNMARERVLAQLRHMGIKNLGSVKRLYLEAGGSFSVDTVKHTAGLCILPPSDVAFYHQQARAAVSVCRECGNRATEAPVCEVCQGDVFIDAII